MILVTLSNWHIPLDELFASIEKQLHSTLQLTLSQCVAGWYTTELFRELCRLCIEFLTDQIVIQRNQHAARTIGLEQRKPLTGDSEAMELYIARELEVLQTARFKARAGEYFDEQDRTTGKTTTGEERTRKIQNDKDLRSKLGPDSYQREVEVMAKIRGYYTVAASSLHAELLGGLGIDDRNCKSPYPYLQCVALTGTIGHDICTRLLEDDPQRAQERVKLKDKKAHLEEAKTRLDSLELEFGMGKGSFVTSP